MRFQVLNKAIAAVAVLSLLLAAGCSDWERTAFQTLAASKGAVDSAVHDYNAGVITKARAAHNQAVDAFHAYILIRVAVQKGGGKTQADQDAARQAAQQLLTELPALLAELQKLVRTDPKAELRHPPLHTLDELAVELEVHDGR